MFGLGAMELVIIAVTLLVLFGGSRLPSLARNVAEASRELRATDDAASSGSRPDV